MEKIIRLSIIVLLIAMFQSACIKRTPERILKQQFNITLQGFQYKVESYEEEWLPNGDGYVLIIFGFKEITQKNINYLQSLKLKKLPITEKNMIPTRFLADRGYYLFKEESPNDDRNFKLFIVDTENKKAILYYQYM